MIKCMFYVYKALGSILKGLEKQARKGEERKEGDDYLVIQKIVAVKPDTANYPPISLLTFFQSTHSPRLTIV